MAEQLHEAPWCKMPMDLILDPEIGKDDLKVFGIIDFKCGKQGWYYGPISDICEDAHMANGTVRRAIATLKKKRFIDTKRLGKDKGFVLCFSILARSTKISPDEGERSAQQRAEVRSEVSGGPLRGERNYTETKHSY